MNFQPNHTFKTLNTRQATRCILLFYLYANFAGMAPPEIKLDFDVGIFNLYTMIDKPVSYKNPKADIIKKLKILKKTTQIIRDRNIQNKMSLFRFKSRQYQLVLKESATKAVKFFSLMLNDNNKINTENLKKVLDLEQFMIEAEAYEPNPLTIFIAFKTRNNSIKLFNMYLKEKMKDLIEEQKDLPHYESEVFDDFDNIIRKMAGPFPERYNLINELAGPLVMAVFIQEKCNIQ